LDGDRNIVVIEFKRDRASDNIVFQTLNYAAWIAEQSYEVLNAFATEFFAKLPEPGGPSSLKEAYYRRFPATTVEGASEEEEETEPALPTDQEFLTGFNTKPRIILVAAEIGDEIQRVMRFLSTHGMRMEGHEFKYYRSPQGDEFISRRVVGVIAGTSSPPPSASSGVRTLDDLVAHVTDDTVRPLIEALQALGDELSFHPEVRFAIPGNGNWRVRFLGKTRAEGYFAKRWAFAWWQDRFNGDVDWFKERLSAPDQVKVDGNGTLRFHIRHADDFEVLKTALQDAYDRAAS